MIKDYILTPFDKFKPHKLSQSSTNGQRRTFVCDDFASLDTETSKELETEDGWLYQWCFSYPSQPPMIKRQLVFGRKPSDLAKTIKKISDVNELNAAHKMNIFVHNLSFDYHYIKDFLEEEFGYKGTTLAIARHKMITYQIGGICFRCTYRLTNKSLDAWGKELGIRHRKLKGTIDYNKQRFQDSPLSKKDWKYMFYDVVVLDECVEKQNFKWEDDMISIPLTITGYVRRECFKHFEEDSQNKRDFKNNALDSVTYRMCRDEFSGGLTHGNRFFADKTLKVRGMVKRKGLKFIRHRDFASHYPSQQVTGYAPSSKFSCYFKFNPSKENDFTWNQLADLCSKKCVLATISISKLKLKPGVTFPYAQTEKFRAGAVRASERFESLEMISDNGRVLEFISGTSIVTMNEYDLKWLKKQYSFSYKILAVYTARRGRFPKYLVDTVKDFYFKKSHYKMIEKKLEAEGVSKDSAEYIENHLNMMIAKAMLNAIYGCTASKIVRTTFYEDKFGCWKTKEPTETEIEEQLESYYNSSKSFMEYCLGCWTTSQARDELLDFVELIGYENVIYVDTDSAFYFSNDEIEAKIEAKNKELREECDKNGWFIECEGKRVYFNQFELEKEDIVSFRFMHAKCYAYEVKKKDGTIELEATIAGVSKYGRNGSTRVKELGSIDNLEDGKVFTKCGGTAIKYINSIPREKEIKGHNVELASAAIIYETEKTLHDAVWYAENLIEWEVEENG